MTIEDITITKIENGVMVKWAEKHPTDAGGRKDFRYEYKEYYTIDLHHAFDKVAALWTDVKSGGRGY